VPFAIFVIVILLMLQLQNVKRMLVVLATGPLALIGVALIMALFRIPFGFVAMLGRWRCSAWCCATRSS
jgi:multidrug efflux pump